MATKLAVPVLALLLVAGLVYYLADWAPAGEDRADLYRIHVTVLGPDGLPADDVRVWSARTGDGRKVEGGWQIELPASLRPADGKVIVFAVREEGLKGAVTIQLGDAPGVESIHATIPLSPLP
jgi:hypothetical protein